MLCFVLGVSLQIKRNKNISVSVHYITKIIENKRQIIIATVYFLTLTTKYIKHFIIYVPYTRKLKLLHRNISKK